MNDARITAALTEALARPRMTPEETREAIKSFGADLANLPRDRHNPEVLAANGLVPCYDCSGTGEQHGFRCGPGRSDTSWPCDTCKGSKVCAYRDPAWKDIGAQARAFRVDVLGITMRDAARHLGVSVPEVSAAECGKIDPGPLVQLFETLRRVRG